MIRYIFQTRQSYSVSDLLHRTVCAMVSYGLCYMLEMALYNIG